MDHFSHVGFIGIALKYDFVPQIGVLVVQVSKMGHFSHVGFIEIALK